MPLLTKCLLRGLIASLVSVGWIAGPGQAAAPNSTEEKAKLIGTPAALVVQPPTVALVGPRSTQQLIVTGRYADGSARDLTTVCDFKADNPNIIDVDGHLFLSPKSNGTAVLEISAGGQSVKLPISVSNVDKPQPVSFRQELIAALNVGGCNSGACHGTPSGKNGFKLSLRGYDPAADYIELTHDVFGRRTSRQGAASSLLYLKGLGRVPHEGGARYGASSMPARTLATWLDEGLRDDPATLATVKKVEVVPGDRVLSSPARWQQLQVLAHFSDGQVRDMTRLTVFSSSDPAIADVDRNGLVEFKQSGEVAILCRYLLELIPIRLTYLEPKERFAWSNPTENNYVDTHVFSKLKMLNILPSDVCNDQEFIRRAYMDVCGVLPEADDVRQFLASTDKDKRAKLVDKLLDRPEYADLWTLKWSDVFRSNRKAITEKGIYVFQAWLRGHISRNTPLDEVIREVLTASGSTYSNPAANYYRVAKDPTALAETTAQLFFGIRMQCAKCHNHPFERWTQDDYYSLAAFFARVKTRKDHMEPGDGKKVLGAEYVYLARAGEVVQPRKGSAIAPRFLGGVEPAISPTTDRRKVLADWITAPDNLFFTKSLVNRVWYHLLGRGVVDPVDDFRDSNPSANDALLDALARDFAAKKFDVKQLIRTIMNSRTYQLSAQTNEFNENDEKYFSHAVTKLHSAEQLFDALCFVTDVPENFPGLPPGTRAVQLPDGEVNHPFLKTFGQPARELACECERENESNLAQALQLINGPAVNDRLRNPNNRLGKLLGKKLTERDMLADLFLVTLSRLPNDAEAQAMLAHVERAMDKRKAWEDVHWALINSKEFLFRH